MKERPILFSAAMVRALLDGRKTQTRRVIKPQPKIMINTDGEFGQYTGMLYRVGGHPCAITGEPVYAWNRIQKLIESCPYGQPGDRLWVRETWTTNMEKDREDKRREAVRYRATDKLASSDGMGWRPSIHMPRWASRITLEITDIRIERVQDIVREDAVAEGCRAPHIPLELRGVSADYVADERTSFAILWNAINDKRGYGWDENPWVWVICFKRIS